MALTEQTVMDQITLLPLQKAINVRWANQIFRDGELISQSYHRKAYTEDQQSEFIAEVENASLYSTAVGWNSN